VSLRSADQHHLLLRTEVARLLVSQVNQPLGFAVVLGAGHDAIDFSCASHCS